MAAYLLPVLNWARSTDKSWLLLMVHPATLIIPALATLCLLGCDRPADKVRSQDASPVATNQEVTANPAVPTNPSMEYLPYSPAPANLVISREEYLNKLQGF